MENLVSKNTTVSESTVNEINDCCCYQLRLIYFLINFLFIPLKTLTNWCDVERSEMADLWNIRHKFC